MSTIAALVRAHQRDPKALYVAPSSERESSPGRYDRTASQKSPALERRQIRDSLPRDRFPDIPQEAWDEFRDYEDIQDYLDGGTGLPDLGGEPLPDIPAPEFPTVDDFPAIGGERLVVAHSSGVSISGDLSAEGGEYVWGTLGTAPSQLRRLSAVDDARIAVATESAVYVFRSSDSAWTPVILPGLAEIEIPLINGDFEEVEYWNGNGWALVSGDSPRRRSTTNPPQMPGSTHYMTRDWVAGGTGEFEIRQLVSLPEGEGALTLSADVWVEPGSQVELWFAGVDGASIGGPGADGGFQSFDFSDGHLATNFVSEVGQGFFVPAQLVKSGVANINATWMVKYYTFTTTSRMTGGPGTLSMSNGASDRRAFGFEVVFTDAAGAEVPVSGEFIIGNLDSNSSTGDFVLVVGQNDRVSIAAEPRLDGSPSSITTQAASYDLAINYGHSAVRHMSVPGTSDNRVRITVDNESRFYIALGKTTGNGTFTLEPAAGAGAEPAVSNQDKAWHRIETTLQRGTIDELAIHIAGRGTPADVYVDNVSLKIIQQDTGAAIAAIERNAGAAAHMITDRTRQLRLKSGAVSIVGERAAAITHLAALEYGDSWSAASTPSGSTIWLPWGAETSIGEGIKQLVSGPRAVVVTSGGAVMEYRQWEKPALVLHTPVAPSATLAWSGSLGVYIRVEADGMAFVSEDLDTWTALPKIQVSGSQLWRVHAAPSGRIYAHVVGGRALSWLEPGATAWKYGGDFGAVIADIDVI